MIEIAVFLFLFGTSYVVSHSWSIRITRAFETGGRLRGRSTVHLFAAPLLIVGFLLAAAFLAIGELLIGLDPMNDEPIAPWEAAVLGVLTPVFVALIGWASFRAVAALPPRRRGRPPVTLLRLVAPAVRWGSSVLVAVMVVVLGTAFVIGWRADPPGGTDLLLFVVLVPLTLFLCFYYGTRGSRRLDELAAQWSGPPDSAEQIALYLRPFIEERTVFASDQTFEEFLGPEIRARLGEFVALGSPQDRLPPPGGARRVYHSDQSWQAAVEELTRTARCIVCATGSSGNTRWELARIRELGLHSKLFLVSPPPFSVNSTAAVDAPVGWWRFVAAVANAYLDMDADRLTRLLGRGRSPSAYSPTTPVAWSDLADELSSCGYNVVIDEPGPGAVIGFDITGATVLLVSAAQDAREFVDPMVARVG